MASLSASESSSSVIDQIKKDLLYVFKGFYLLTGVRIHNDTYYHQYLRYLLISYFIAYIIYSLATGVIFNVLESNHLKPDFILILSTYIWFVCIPLEIHYVQTRVSQFLAYTDCFETFSRLKSAYFQSRRAISVRVIRWGVALYIFNAQIQNLINLWRQIQNPEVDRSRTLNLIIFYLNFMHFLIVSSIIHGVSLYFGCYFRILYNAIRLNAEELQNASEIITINGLMDIYIIYNQLTECIAAVEKILSPIIICIIVCHAPSLIIFLPRLAATLMNFICEASGFVFIILSISWITVHYSSPYEAIYQLSFDCSLQQLTLVSTIMINCEELKVIIYIFQFFFIKFFR